MKKSIHFLLDKYSRMSGDKKIHLGLTLSHTVRRVRQDGILATKRFNGNRSRRSS